MRANGSAGDDRRWLLYADERRFTRSEASAALAMAIVGTPLIHAAKSVSWTAAFASAIGCGVVVGAFTWFRRVVEDRLSDPHERRRVPR